MQRILISLTLLLAATAISANVEIISNSGYKLTASTKGYSVLEVLGKKIHHVDVESKLCNVDKSRTLSLGKVVFKPYGANKFTMYVTDKSGTTYPVRVQPSSKISPALIILKDTKFFALKRYLGSNEYKQRQDSKCQVSPHCTIPLRAVT